MVFTMCSFFPLDISFLKRYRIANTTPRIKNIGATVCIEYLLLYNECEVSILNMHEEISAWNVLNLFIHSNFVKEVIFS